jgi:hypothetical protein
MALLLRLCYVKLGFIELCILLFFTFYFWRLQECLVLSVYVCGQIYQQITNKLYTFLFALTLA